MKKVALVSLDGEINGPLAVSLDAMHIAQRLAGQPLFDITTYAPQPKPGERPTLRADRGLVRLADGRFDAVVLPGLGVTLSQDPLGACARPDVAQVIVSLPKLHAAGSLIAASCAATFVLAESGLLGAGPATTSWWLAALFRARFPLVDLRDGELVTQRGQVFCAGGSLAHVEMMLALLARLTDKRLASMTARYLVSPRRAQQSIHANVMEMQIEDPLVARMVRFVGNHLAEELTMTRCADAVHTSVRTLERRVRAALGLTPQGLVQRMRAEKAIRLLVETRQPLEQITEKVGYEDTTTLRQLIVRTTGLTPRALRQMAQG